MKKFLSLVICLALSLGLLSGCNGSVEHYVDMMGLLKDMNNIKEGEFSLELSYSDKSVDRSAEASAQEDQLTSLYSSFDFSADGSFSYDKKQTQMSLNLIDEDGTSTELTDIITIDKDSYVDMSALLDVLAPILLESYGNVDMYSDILSEYFGTIMDGKDYIFFEDSSTGDTQTEVNELGAKLNGIIFETVAEMDVVTFEDNSYKIVLSGDNFKKVATPLFTDISDNAAEYAEILSGMWNSMDMDSSESMFVEIPSAVDLEKTIADIADEMLDELDSDLSPNDTYTVSLSFDKATGTYQYGMEMVYGEEKSSIKVDSTITKAEVADISPPNSYLTFEELQTNIEEFSLSPLDPGSDTSASEDNSGTTLNYNTETANLQSFIDRDFSTYENLHSYDFELESGNTYSVPLVSSEDINVYDGSLMIESPGMWQYVIPFDNYDYGDTAKSFIEWYVKDDYDTDYENPSNSDMLVSPDESMAAMSFSFDDPDYGRITMIYVAMIVTEGEEILMLNLDVYHKYMEAADYSILSDLGSLIGTDFTALIDLNTTTM